MLSFSSSRQRWWKDINPLSDKELANIFSHSIYVSSLCWLLLLLNWSFWVRYTTFCLVLLWGYFFLTFLNIKFFEIGQEEREEERRKKRGREGGHRGWGGRKIPIFHLLVHSSNGCNGQGWARPKPGAGNSIQCVAGAQVHELSSAVFSSMLAVMWIWRAAGTQTGTLIWGMPSPLVAAYLWGLFPRNHCLHQCLEMFLLFSSRDLIFSGLTFRSFHPSWVDFYI